MLACLDLHGAEVALGEGIKVDELLKQRLNGNLGIINRLAKITQTQTCDIWCQTYDLRIYLFDSRREKFIDILRPYENEKQQTYAVQNVYTLPKGVSWIVCDRGAFRIDEQAYKAQEGEGITLYNIEEKNPVFPLTAAAQGQEHEQAQYRCHYVSFHRCHSLLVRSLLLFRRSSTLTITDFRGKASFSTEMLPPKAAPDKKTS